MKTFSTLLAVTATLAAGCTFGAGSSAVGEKHYAQRLYVFDCGELKAPDLSVWTPGYNQGQPAHLSENCYLIQHRDGYLMWDTGISDSLQGKTVQTHGITLGRQTSLAEDLKKIGVAPEAVKYVAVSHTHPDHTGNLNLFPEATLLIQRSEADWSPGAGFLKIPEERKTQLLDGDYDVFGDGSVRILSLPGHTPGHQSLLINLPNTGHVLLSGDVAHLHFNYEKGIVPSLNIDKEKSLESIERAKQLAAQYGATVWINHDLQDSASKRRVPEFYD